MNICSSFIKQSVGEIVALSKMAKITVAVAQKCFFPQAFNFPHPA
jgi:hypothetical protein